MHQLFSHIKHLITASNQYGVHSPFVYNYLTKCLYVNRKYKGSKCDRILLKSIPYLSIEKIKINASDSRLSDRIQKEHGLKTSAEGPFDLIYEENTKKNMLSFLKDEIHNDTMLIIDKIHSNKKASVIWHSLKENDMVTISIDFFHCGVLFFRNEQEKEHFKIRI